MVRIIALSNLRLAQAFVDYMATYDVALKINDSNQGAEIWLIDEQQSAHVRYELEQFLLDQLHPRYQAASWLSGNTHSNFSYQHYSYLKILRHQTGPLTLIVIALCIITYILMQLTSDDTVMLYLAWPQDNHQYFQLWRWISHSFLHFSLLHILFNLIWWWYLSHQIEKQLGGSKLFVLSLVAAFVSGWAQSLFSGFNFGGLSGVVYALIGYVWLTGERAPDSGISLPRGLMVFSVFWLVAGYFSILSLSTANAAHLAGLVIGLLMAFWDTRNSVRIA